MAVFGLQVDFTNDLLKQYFGMKRPNIIAKQIYIGLGLTQEGAQQNLEDFNEVFSGKPLGNYTRARVIFGKAHNNQISNISEVAFQTASEDWTTPKCLVEMLGLFDTMEYMDAETKQLIKPLIVLPLETPITIQKAETLILAKDAITLHLTDEQE